MHLGLLFSALHLLVCDVFKCDNRSVSLLLCIRWSFQLTYPFFFHLPDGELGPKNNVKAAYMKQKHRMLWERRHGPVGTGMKKSTEDL